MEPDRGDTESPGNGDLGTFLAIKFTVYPIFAFRKLLFRHETLTRDPQESHETPRQDLDYKSKQNGVRLLQGRSLGGFSSRS